MENSKNIYYLLEYLEDLSNIDLEEIFKSKDEYLIRLQLKSYKKAISNLLMELKIELSKELIKDLIKKKGETHEKLQ